MPIFQNIAYFLFAVVFSKGFEIARSYILAYKLGPAQYGSYITLLLIVSYSPIVCLGTVETLLKLVPFYRGQNNTARIKEIEGSVLGSVVIAAIVIIGFAILTPLALHILPVKLNPYLISIVFLSVAVSFVTAYFYHRFAAYENFKAAGKTDIIRAIGALLIVGGMAWIWNLLGAVVGLLVIEIIMLIITYKRNIHFYGKPIINFNRALMANAVYVGFPITILWFVMTLQGTVDRLVLAGFLGPVAVGHYSLGLSVTGLLILVPTVVGRVLYPAVNKRIGENAEPESIKRIILFPTYTLSALLANAQLMILFLLPVLYCVLLPKYQPGLLAGKILLIGSFFGCLLRNAANYLIAANEQNKFLLYIVMALIVTAILDITFVYLGWNITGIAFGTSIGGLFLTTQVWRRALIKLGCGNKMIIKYFLKIYFPFIFVLCNGIIEYVLFGSNESYYSFKIILFYSGSFLILNVCLLALPDYRSQITYWSKNIKSMKPVQQGQERL